MKPEKILVLSLRYLGDTLLTRPTLRALRLQFPESKIDILVPSTTEVALENFPYNIRPIVWPRSTQRAIRRAMKIFVQGYDWVIDLTGNDRTALLSLLSRASLRVCYEKKQPWWPRWRSRLYNLRITHEKKKPHKLLQHQKLLEACDVTFQGISLELKSNEKAEKKIASFFSAYLGKKVILAHLTSRDMQKSLPIPLVRQVMSDLIKQNITIIFTHGKARQEKDYVTACVQGFASSQLQIMPQLSWDELIALIMKVDVYWGVDTAPTHIASDLQKPMLVHYGPSHVEQWRPLNPKAEIIISSCTCLKTKQCPEGVSGKCFNSLSASQIISTLEKLLKNY